MTTPLFNLLAHTADHSFAPDGACIRMRRACDSICKKRNYIPATPCESAKSSSTLSEGSSGHVTCASQR